VHSIFKRFREPIFVIALLAVPFVLFFVRAKKGRDLNPLDRAVIFVIAPAEKVITLAVFAVLNMAAAAAQWGMTLQYCMPLPRHVLQSVQYGNVTTMRVSDDRFDRNRCRRRGGVLLPAPAQAAARRAGRAPRRCRRRSFGNRRVGRPRIDSWR